MQRKLFKVLRFNLKNEQTFQQTQQELEKNTKHDPTPSQHLYFSNPKQILSNSIHLFNTRGPTYYAKIMSLKLL